MTLIILLIWLPFLAILLLFWFLVLFNFYALIKSLLSRPDSFSALFDSYLRLWSDFWYTISRKKSEKK